MSRDLFTSLIALAVISQAAPIVTPQQPAANNTSANVSPTGGIDPAGATFATETGLVLHAVKAASVTDYEAAITALQEALAKSEDAETRQVAAGWRVYKSTDLDAKANPIYVHLLQPTVAGVDYRPSLWLDKLLAGAPPELLAKYRDAFAAPPTKLPLIEFANMSVAPVPKPTNGSPSAPTNGTAPAATNGTAPQPAVR